MCVAMVSLRGASLMKGNWAKTGDSIEIVPRDTYSVWSFNIHDQKQRVRQSRGRFPQRGPCASARFHAGWQHNQGPNRFWLDSANFTVSLSRAFPEQNNLDTGTENKGIEKVRHILDIVEIILQLFLRIFNGRSSVPASTCAHPVIPGLMLWRSE